MKKLFEEPVVDVVVVNDVVANELPGDSSMGEL